MHVYKGKYMVEKYTTRLKGERPPKLNLANDFRTGYLSFSRKKMPHILFWMEPHAQQPVSSQGALSQAADIIKKRKYLFQNAITSEQCICFLFRLHRYVLRDETNKTRHKLYVF